MNSKIKFAIILAVLFLSLGSVFVSAESTEIYHEISTTADILDRWQANTDRLWKLSYELEGQHGNSYIAWSLVEAKPGDKGLVPGVALEVVFTVNAATRNLDALTFEFIYASALRSNFEYIKGKTEIYVSVDGGKTYKPKAATLQLHDYTGQAIQNTNDKALLVLFKCVSTDLLDLVGKNEAITHIKLKPFGDANIKNGLFRFLEASVIGHKGTYIPPVVKEEIPRYETNVNTDEIRKIAADEIKRHATVEWIAKEDFIITWGSSSSTYKKGVKYTGLIYTQKNYRGTIEEFTALLNDKKEYIGVTNEANMPGTHCSSSVDVAWSHVNSTEYGLTLHMTQNVGKNGIYPLGNLKWKEGTGSSGDMKSLNTQQAYYEAYALVKLGDVVMSSRDNGGHVRMATGETNAVRTSSGSIDGSKSYIVMTDNTGSMANNSTWRVDYKYYFDALYKSDYLPYTNKAFTEGEVEQSYVRLIAGNTAKNVKDGLRGMVVSNYRIIELNVKIYDYKGTLVYNRSEHNNTREHTLYYLEANSKIKGLADGRYRLIITATTGPRTSFGDTLDTHTLLDLNFSKGKRETYYLSLTQMLEKNIFLSNFRNKIAG